MSLKINGIQQLGVGVENIEQAWKWYIGHFSMDVKMFEDKATAELMLPHTGGEPRPRHAVLAMNMRGGGGFEIWQHLGKKPELRKTPHTLGDLGINIGILKTNTIPAAWEKLKNRAHGQVEKDPAGNGHFFLNDPYGNLWEVRNNRDVFNSDNSVTGGVLGVVIGVRYMEESLPVYRDLLGYDQVVYDKTGTFDDFKSLPGGDGRFRRLLLRHSAQRTGAFSPFLGESCIELIQALDRDPIPIYKDRIWGDPGFIHICFDINGMDELREKAKTAGFPFTVDSARHRNEFDMGDTAGNFAYIKAPEGTLIEFVETLKIPLLKKLGWYIDIRKRGSHPLPRWMLGMFRFKKIKRKHRA